MHLRGNACLALTQGSARVQLNFLTSVLDYAFSGNAPTIEIPNRALCVMIYNQHGTWAVFVGIRTQSSRERLYTAFSVSTCWNRLESVTNEVGYKV